MTDEYGTSALIYEGRNGEVVMSEITGPRSFYEATLESTKLFAERIIFTRYGITDAQSELFIGQMEAIDNKPFSEVSEQVEGLIARLKRDKR